MTLAAEPHAGPWTEQDLLDLPDNGVRHELLEGALLVNPPPAPRHQRVGYLLTKALDGAVPADLIVVEAIGVRIPDGSMLIPDVLVVDRDQGLANRSGIVDPGLVRLAVEVASPSSHIMDRLTKPTLYARAGVPHFWRVEIDDAGPAVHSCLLDRGVYVEWASSGPGEVFDVDRPFPFQLPVDDLRP